MQRLAKWVNHWREKRMLKQLGALTYCPSCKQCHQTSPATLVQEIDWQDDLCRYQFTCGRCEFISYFVYGAPIPFRVPGPGEMADTLERIP